MKHTQNLFSYGSLQQEEVQKTILGRTLKGKSALLKGYRISEKKIYGKYPLIERSPQPTDSVEGTVFKVSNFELYEIDHYESEAYQRVRVKLGSGINAWVYVENLG